MRSIMLLIAVTLSLLTAQVHGYTHDLHADHDLTPSCEYCLSASQLQALEKPDSAIEVPIPNSQNTRQFPTASPLSADPITSPPARGPPLSS